VIEWPKIRSVGRHAELIGQSDIGQPGAPLGTYRRPCVTRRLKPLKPVLVQVGEHHRPDGNCVLALGRDDSRLLAELADRAVKAAIIARRPVGISQA